MRASDLARGGIDHDVVVVGGGIAGLVAALSAAEPGGPVRPSVGLVTAGRLAGGCSRWAQGGIAVAVGDDDSAELHAVDTLVAGRGLCDAAAVHVLVGEAAARLADLAAWGVRFDTDPLGDLRLGREAAHSRSRIVHGGGDATGRTIVEALAARARAAGVDVYEGQLLTGLLPTEAGACGGVEVADETSGERRRLVAPATVLATGGAGRLWRRTTNPAGAVGVGVGLAFELGAEVSGMEFMQFHPTALAIPGSPAFLLSEALRGEGARVRNAGGERFLLAADPRGELAPRDTVAAAIWDELRRSGAEAVLLDTAPLGRAAEGRFPTIHAALLDHGLRLGRDGVPVAPAAHYSIGGVRTDLDGATSIPGLLACGEVASSGVHGANRLASNSLLEAVVFGRRAGRQACGLAAEAPRPRIDEERSRPAVPGSSAAPARSAVAGLEARLGEAMWRGAGLVRDAADLERLRAEIDVIAADGAALPFPSSVTHSAATRSASLVCQAALLRRESRGSHLRSDHHAADPAQRGSWVLHHDRGPRFDRNPRPDH